MLTQLIVLAVLAILSVSATASTAKSFLRRLDDCGDQDVPVDQCNIHACVRWLALVSGEVHRHGN